jgi:hypothetical protein
MCCKWFGRIDSGIPNFYPPERSPDAACGGKQYILIRIDFVEARA